MIRYEVLGQLAQGGMGEILLARRLGAAGFEKLVVLKRPLARARGSAALVVALIEEARLLARINHPNVCQVHDLEEADGEYFLALEYLEGLSLWAVLADPGAAPRPIPPRVLCALFAQACDGLDAIHTLRDEAGRPIGAVHRDISPGNLFVTEAGALKILDLGIAKTQASEDRTPFGNVKGKLPYLSPEQVRGKPVDARTDLFSLGLVLHDAARGVRPLPDRVGAFARDALDLATLPPAIARIVERAIEVEPDARFASAREMRAALCEAAGSMPTQGEIGEWLAVHGAAELAERRARLGTAPDDHTATQIMTLRSAIGCEPLGTQQHALAGARQTEQLALPDDERLVRPRPRRTWPYLVLAAALAIGGVVALVIASGRTAVDEHPVAAAPPVKPVPAPQPQPPPPAPEPAPEPAVPPLAPVHRAPPHHREAAHHAPGQLSVDSQPYAMVKLGPRSLGATPIFQLSLEPGRYQLHASTADGREQDVTVQIESGHERKLKLEWGGK